MKKKLLAFTLCALMVAPSLLACSTGSTTGGNNPVTPAEGDAEDWYTTYESVSPTDYNQDLYYINEYNFKLADPSVIYIDHGKEEGYFYAYGTSDLVEGYGIQCWRSRDLTNWEYKSESFTPDPDNTWGYKNHWAPEVIYDKGDDLYYMFYNADYPAADKYTPPDDWGKLGEKAKSISVVCAKEPYGPFVPVTKDTAANPVYDFSDSNPEITDKRMCRSSVIDAHPFIDPVTGDKYLYYSGYGHDGIGGEYGQTIFGVKMHDKDWLNPDYSTLKELTKLFNSTVTGTDNDMAVDEGMGVARVNEAPFVWYKDGKYYLTFSVFTFEQTNYQVRQAIADGPLGEFTKLTNAEGGQIIYTEPSWSGKISSAGHHCFITCGDSLMIAYHSFYNRRVWNPADARAIAIDTVSWIKNDDGVDIMHANGPTYAYMPLPEEISGYKNLAPLATVTSDNTAQTSEIKYLTDGVIKTHNSDFVNEYATAGGKTTITLKFNNWVDVSSLMVYNSLSYNNTFVKLNSVTLNCKGADGKAVARTVKDVPFDYDWHTVGSKTVYPGASSVLEFADMPVNEISITINASKDEEIRINEIVVLGKASSTAAGGALSSYKHTVHDPVQALPVYESTTFGSVNGYYRSNYGFDLSHDDGTADAYVDKTWSGNQQKLYFKDVESTVLYVEVEMSVLNHTKAYNSDPAPKAGIVLTMRNNFFLSYNIDYRSTFNNPQVGFVKSNSTGSDYFWAQYQAFDVPGLKYSGDNYAKLGLARVGSTLYMFANDKLVYTTDDTGMFSDSDNTASAVSFVTFNCFTRFKNYKCVTGDSVLTILAEKGVTVE